jgi:hypothetical protein
VFHLCQFTRSFVSPEKSGADPRDGTAKTRILLKNLLGIAGMGVLCHNSYHWAAQTTGIQSETTGSRPQWEPETAPASQI